MIKGTYKGDWVFDLNPEYDEKVMFCYADGSFHATADFEDGELDFDAMRNDPGLIRDIKARDLECRRFYDAREHS